MLKNGKCSYEIDRPQFERSRALISARALQKAALALWAPKIGALALFALASASSGERRSPLVKLEHYFLFWTQSWQFKIHRLRLHIVGRWPDMKEARRIERWCTLDTAVERAACRLQRWESARKHIYPLMWKRFSFSFFIVIRRWSQHRRLENLLSGAKNIPPGCRVLRVCVCVFCLAAGRLIGIDK
jgi:hypothetical protein